ncbi:MAG: RpiB/LacA/LacB family sugar-phosphate isomerase [Bdellovibrionales bacterium]
MTQKTIYLASDHRGVALRGVLADWLRSQSYVVNDLGPMDTTRVNASDFAVRLATAMREDKECVGVLVCGTGQAMAMTANRFAHIRAALCVNGFMARLARQHNDANVLAMGAELVGEGLALECLQVFLTTEALSGVYAARCRMLTDMGGL